mmetsp:Transcript_13728/g.26594  ORF Transcript_13728/g.26594 Transcript_13728/m.26594 type:complete len:418 (+) Transcript_13728:37-1290(+)
MERCILLVAPFADGRDLAAVACCSSYLDSLLSSNDGLKVWEELAESHFALSLANTSWRCVVELPSDKYTVQLDDPKASYLAMRSSMIWSGLNFEEYRKYVLPAGLAWQKLYDAGYISQDPRLELYPPCGKFPTELRRFGQAAIEAYALWAFHNGQNPSGHPLFGETGAYQYIFHYRFCSMPDRDSEDLTLAIRSATFDSRWAGGPARFIPSRREHEDGWIWDDRPDRPSQAGVVEMFVAFAQSVFEKRFQVSPQTMILQRFPLSGPETVTTSAHGIRITVSACEMEDLNLPRWAYQFRIEATEDLPCESCQLDARQWTICIDDSENTIRGPGVVGQYPILFRGGGWKRGPHDGLLPGPFVYNSFVGPDHNRAMLSGTFRGVLEFKTLPESSSQPLLVPVGPLLLRSHSRFQLGAATE